MRNPGILPFLLLTLLLSSWTAFCASADASDLESRGSSGSGGGSKPPSPSKPNGKGPAHESHPAHEGHSVRLFGVQVAPGKPSGPGHPSHTTQSHSAHPSGHPIQHAHTPTLGRLVPDMGSDKYAHKRVSNPVGRPRKGTADTRVPSRKEVAAMKTSEPKTKEKWWNKKGGTPNIQGGTHKWYSAQRKYREKKKLEKQGGPVSEHPSGHHPHGGGGPGSPGAGTHAVSKRRLAAWAY